MLGLVLHFELVKKWFIYIIHAFYALQIIEAYSNEKYESNSLTGKIEESIHRSNNITSP